MQYYRQNIYHISVTVSNQLGRAGARNATSSENGGQAGIGEYPGLDFSNISQFN